MKEEDSKMVDRYKVAWEGLEGDLTYLVNQGVTSIHPIIALNMMSYAFNSAVENSWETDREEREPY